MALTWQRQVLCHKRMCIHVPRTQLTRHHRLISSFVSCPVCFQCSFAPCYEVLMTTEPFEELFRKAVRTVCSQLSCVCSYHCHLTLNCSSALCLELSVSFLGTVVGYTKWWRRFMSVASWVLSLYLLFSEPFPWFRVKMPLWWLLGVVIQDSTLCLN